MSRTGVVLINCCTVLHKFPSQKLSGSCQEFHGIAGKTVGCLMCADLIVNRDNYPDLLQSTRKVCSFLSSKIGFSREDLPPLTKVKLDELSDGSLGPHLPFRFCRN